ncbi:MAG: SDR family oxidoreductase [Candidatus Kariarchaeaceae archaeon]
MDIKKSILVTGASSGIGYHLSTFLAKKGHLVYATVRKDIDIDRLEKIENVFPIKVDVTNTQHIENAVRIIGKEDTGLYGVVNNAGIGDLGFHYSFSEEDMFHLFNVNTFGPWRITNAFLHLLIESKGRVVNIGSQGGMVTKKIFGPYTMTKFALEAYTDSLREELEPVGIKVSIVQPGGIKSEIGEKAMDDQIRRFSETKQPFDEEAKKILEFLQLPSKEFDQSKPESNSNRKISHPQIVTEAVYDALFAANPRHRYLVGTKWEGDRVIFELISKLLDENMSSKVHNYSRDELVEILDKVKQEKSIRL